MKYLYIDFEFNKVSEKDYNLVCAAFVVGKVQKSFWLFNNPEEKEKLKQELINYSDKGYTIVCFGTAEPRSFCALGLNPIGFSWVDLHIEYRMLLNHNHKYAYGPQLKNGKVINTSPPKPKWALSEEEKMDQDFSKPSYSLAAAIFKLLDIKIDTDQKDKMRDLIISEPSKFSKEEKREILAYCLSDVLNLPELHKTIEKVLENSYQGSDKLKFRDEMLKRGEYSARTSVMERLGYPVNVTATKNFVNAIPKIMEEMQTDINSQFEIKPFKWNKAAKRYSMDLGVIRDWIKSQPLSIRKGWIKTDTGMHSVSVDAFAQKFHFRHNYPRGDFGAQILRFFKFRQSLNGFLPKSENAKNKETFFDYVGSDGRCRPYMGIYGAQSARSQPKATGFIPLKAAWMRSLIQPKKGRVCFGIDYSSQEFLISALVSNDSNMVDAYKSGDVYLSFGKSVGAIPQNATKKTHSKEREPFKSTVLGVSYNMGAASLAEKLTQDTGIEYTEDQAELLISYFYSVYSSFDVWNDTNKSEYYDKKYLKMPCGWTMWGDNENYRSINNVVIQGTGASILRKAVELAQDRGVHVIYTLHDAVYGECKVEEAKEKIDILWDAMHEAFVYYFSDKKSAALIRLEGDVWGPDLKEGEFKTSQGRVLKAQKIYIDERSVHEYKQFSKYFRQ